MTGSMPPSEPPSGPVPPYGSVPPPDPYGSTPSYGSTPPAGPTPPAAYGTPGQAPQYGATPPYGTDPSYGAVPPGSVPPGAVPPYGAMPGGAPYVPPPATSTTNGMAIGALICGILSLPVSFIPFVNIMAIILGLVAIVLGFLARRKATGKGLAMGGIIAGAVGVLISIIVIVVTVVALGSVAQQAGQIGETLNAPVQVDMSATAADGTAQLSYGAVASLTDDSFSGSWSKSETLQGSDVGVMVTVTADPSASSSDVSCEIKVNGQVSDSQTGSGMVMCSASLIQ